MTVHFLKLHKTCVTAPQSTIHGCQINKQMLGELSGIKMKLRILYVGSITAVVGGTSLFPSAPA